MVKPRLLSVSAFCGQESHEFPHYSTDFLYPMADATSNDARRLMQWAKKDARMKQDAFLGDVAGHVV